MRRMMRAAALSALLHAGAACGDGFVQPNVSPSVAALGGAFVARADDATAALMNPAGFAWFRGGWMLGQIADYRNQSVRRAGGVHPNRATAPTSMFFYGGRFFPRHGLGLSFAYLPLYDLRTDWRTMGAGSAQISAELFSLGVIAAASSRLAFGASVDLWQARIALAHGGASIGGKRTGLGGQLSLLWRPVPELSFGLSYRKAPRFSLAQQGRRTVVQLPDALRLGLGWQQGRWRFDLDWSWRRWSQLKDLSIAPVSFRPVRLHDTLGVMLGASYAFRERAQWRFGVAYDPSASASAGFDPLVADQAGYRVSFGLGGEALTLHWDFALAYTFYPQAKRAGAYAGSYRDRKFAFVMALGKRF